MANRRSVLTAIAGAGAAIACAAVMPAQGQQKYPDRPIRMIVPFPPGGPIDTMARVVAEELSTRVGQVVVENRAGGGSTIGTKFVATADADGYTLLFGSSGLVEYTVVAWCIGAAAVRFYEEPILARKFGAEYQAYRRAVPAWVPRLRPWTPGQQ